MPASEDESRARKARLVDTITLLGTIWTVIATVKAVLDDAGGVIVGAALAASLVIGAVMAGVSIRSPTSQAARVIERLGRAPRRVVIGLGGWLAGLGVDGPSLARVGGGAAAGLVAVGVLSALVAVAPGLVRPCPLPLELRLVTSGENVPALRDATSRFAREKTSARGCPPVRFTVDRQPPLLEMAAGARTGWYDPATTTQNAHRALVGIHADIWLSSSRETQAYVVEAFENHRSTAELIPMGTVATSALVVAATPDLAARIDTTTAPHGTLADMRSVLSSSSVAAPRNLLRPRADLSEAALIASAALFPAGQPAGGDVKTEIALTPPDLPMDDGVQLLCHVRTELAKGNDEGLAMIVPEHLVHSFGQDRPVGPCASPRYGGALRAYPVSDLPTTDYGFVAIRWRGQLRAERDGWVRDFHGWLADGQLSRYGYRSPDGVLSRGPLGDTVPMPKEDPPQAKLSENRATAVATLIDRVRAAHPGMSFLIAVDSSRSMDNPLAGDSALDAAGRAGQELVGRLRDGTDTVTFATFSGPGGPLRLDAAAGTAAVSKRLSELAVDGSDAPLADVLAQAQEAMSTARKPVVVLLTDGASQTGAVSQLKEIPDLDVLLVLTGAQTCAAKHVDDLVKAAGKTIRCARPSTINEELVKLWLANK